MSSLGTPTGLGAKNSLRLSPSKVRNRGSGELVEFCAESLQGSKQYVRQEPAQDPAGHDLLAPLVIPASPFHLDVESSAPSAGGLSLVPPCPSPQIDDIAAVSSGSSYASSQGDSQPGSATSQASARSSTSGIARAFPMATEAPAPAELAGLALAPYVQQDQQQPQLQQNLSHSPVLSARRQQLQQQEDLRQLALHEAGSFGSGGCEVLATAASLAPSGSPRPFGLPPDGLLPAVATAPYPSLGIPKLAAGVLASELAAAAEGPAGAGKGGWGMAAAMGAGALAPLELAPEGEVMIGASRSIVEETDFVTPVSLSLTPIRTRANTDTHEPQESTPVAYVDHLAPPSDTCGGMPKVLPAVRAAINIFATATTSSRVAPPPPGAYNPYDRTALGSGMGYGGGRSYGYSYGGAPSGPPTSSWGGALWAAQQHHGSRQEARRPPPAAPKPPAAAAASGGQSWWGGPAKEEEEEVEHIVMVPGGVRRQQQQQRAEEEGVEHIVMVPGMRRRAPARPLFDEPAADASGQADDSPAAASYPAPVVTVAAGAPYTVDAPVAAGEGAVPASSRVAAAAVVAKECPAVQRTAGDGSKRGRHILKQVLRAALLVGAAAAVATSSNA